MKINIYNNVKKTVVSLALVSAVILSLNGCGNASAQSKTTGKNNVQDVLDSQVAKESSEAASETTELTEENTESDLAEMSEADIIKKAFGDDTASGSDEEEATVSDAQPDSSVDVDLTVMNSDMVYATVYQMMADSESYIGKKIKISGTYYACFYEDTQKWYHYVLIKDALACCQQGLEFVWDDGSHVYPDEYPADNSEVEVIGTFDTYKDNPDDPYEYVYLTGASLVVKESAPADNKE